MIKQLIIARKDLKMSPGKLAAQVSHASMAFLINPIRDNARRFLPEIGINKPCFYCCDLTFDTDMFEDWIADGQTKVVCGTKHKDKLIAALEKADELGIEYFPIYDQCRTELEPEEKDGTTLTCVGFKPMDEEIIDQIGKEFHLY